MRPTPAREDPLKKFAWILLVPVLLAGAGYGFLASKHPAVAPAGKVKVEMSPERIERGRYLFETVADCSGCHSTRDYTKFAGPLVEATRGSGFAWPEELGFPGRVFSPNITPDPETGIGNWTDGEKIRAIREGVSRDGRALFSFMPYTHFAKMSDDDVHSVVAYMNSLAPVRKAQPRTELDFPVKYLVNDIPRPVDGPVSAPDSSDRVKYGEYLVTLASCVVCHTKLDKGAVPPELAFSGGEEFRLMGMMVRSANITPDEETGIGNWTEDRFVAKFRGYAEMTAANAPAHTQATLTVMPWLALSKLTDDDVRAIYSYLRTVKPIRNPVVMHPQPGTF